MDYSTIQGAMRNCKYRGNAPLYVLKTPIGTYCCKTGPSGLTVGDEMPDMNKGYTVARVL